MSVGFGGLLWYPEADTYSLNIPSLCFERKQRGKLPEGAFGFDPKDMSMEDYVPENLSRSKLQEQWQESGIQPENWLQSPYALNTILEGSSKNHLSGIVRFHQLPGHFGSKTLR